METSDSGVNSITWSVYNKPLAIYKTSGTISYTYNTANQRVSKTENGLTTWYVRDAQGNLLALYDNTHTTTWREQYLYGSSRLGFWKPNMNTATGTAPLIWDTIGRKVYELDNHLGNVMTTVTDKRLQHSTSGTAIDYYLADVASAQDYYPFGMLQPGRQYTFGSDSTYRYGFNGKENDNNVKGLGNQQDYGERIYDPRVGRFLSVDPLSNKYPFYSPFQFAGNKPTKFIDLDGLEEDDAKEEVTPKTPQQEELEKGLKSPEDDPNYENKLKGEEELDRLKEKKPEEYYKRLRELTRRTNYENDIKSKLGRAQSNLLSEEVETPYGPAKQALTEESLAVKKEVESGTKLYRIGKMGVQESTEGQFWSTENPLENPRAYEIKYGLKPGSISEKDFIEVGTIKPNTSFITRPAPPFSGSPPGYGGGIEVVTPANGVKLDIFSTFVK